MGQEGSGCQESDPLCGRVLAGQGVSGSGGQRGRVLAVGYLRVRGGQRVRESRVVTLLR